MTTPRPVHDAACLVLRLGLATVFVAHGWQKVYDWTIDGTADRFAEMSIPFPEVSAPVVAVLELVGGGMLGLGVFTRLVAAGFVVSMVGAIALVHVENGPFVGNGGFELALALAAGSLAIVLLGPGRARLDRLLIKWFSKEDEELVEVAPRGRK